MQLAVPLGPHPALDLRQQQLGVGDGFPHRDAEPDEIAKGVEADAKIRNQLKQFEDQGYGNFPICIAKTQYSFSTDPGLKGAPSGHVLPIREVNLSSGAEFIVVVCGAIMTMPGLPRVPAADSIKLNAKGETEGLF